MSKQPPALSALAYFTVLFLVGGYFTYSSVQGDYGLFRRIQIEAEANALKIQRDRLAQEVAMMQNRARRLSDEFLDLDLLDQQARDVLGLVRADEIVLR